ncbi:MAG: small basic protein [Candidatus Omnitrophica bacterium]|nr:small basic protein [Candidatus Omnitrophota bacterium]
MSVHPSLAAKGKGKRQRSVLKRFERLKELQEKEKWKPEDSVFGLPKLKVVRWKAKKTKKAVEETAAAEQPAQAAATTAKTPTPGASSGAKEKKEQKPAKK